MSCKISDIPTRFKLVLVLSYQVLHLLLSRSKQVLDYTISHRRGSPSSSLRILMFSRGPFHASSSHPFETDTFHSSSCQNHSAKTFGFLEAIIGTKDRIYSNIENDPTMGPPSWKALLDLPCNVNIETLSPNSLPQPILELPRQILQRIAWRVDFSG